MTAIGLSSSAVCPAVCPAVLNLRIRREQRERLNGHAGGVLYLTGLSGAGKSTLAALLEHRLHDQGLHTFLIDGDELRTGLCRDLGFSDADRVENMRRALEAARLMVDAGLVVISALISPFAAERAQARARFAPGEFMEVFIDAPLALCEQRDPKGLYRRARRREIIGFTGIDSPYEAPSQPEVRIDSATLSPADAVALLMREMAAFGLAAPGWTPATCAAPTASRTS